MMDWDHDEGSEEFFQQSCTLQFNAPPLIKIQYCHASAVVLHNDAIHGTAESSLQPLLVTLWCVLILHFQKLFQVPNNLDVLVTSL